MLLTVGTNNKDSRLRSTAWIVGGFMVLAFIAAPIVDIDHPIAFLLGITNARFLMAYFAVAGYWAIGCGVVLGIACICRCAWIRFLENTIDKR
jgi:heme/copper-type cytochrome/quinol oxidase subunit 3